MTIKLKNYAMALMMGMGLAGVSTAAHAADDISVFADIGAQSQYIFRGAAQSVNNDPSIQGDVGIEHSSGVSANVWFATGVDVGAGQETEFDFTVDYSGEINDIGYSVGYIAYKYTDSNLNVNEFYVGASYDIASLTAYISDTYNYIEASAGTSIDDMFDVSLSAGVFSPDVGSSVNTYTLGLSKDFDNISANVTLGKFDTLNAEFAAGVNYAF